MILLKEKWGYILAIEFMVFASRLNLGQKRKRKERFLSWGVWNSWGDGSAIIYEKVDVRVIGWGVEIKISSKHVLLS